MAHAGTPADLAKQPATSTTNGPWQALLAMILFAALVASMVIIGANVATSRSVVPAAGHKIEAQRGPTTAAAAQIYVVDQSYTQVETNRGGALSSGTRLQGHFGGP